MTRNCPRGTSDGNGGRSIFAARNMAKGEHIPYTKEQLKGMFWRYDKNGDGRLSRQELREAFKFLGAVIPRWRASRALHYADGNGDGYISEEEVDELAKYAVQFGYTIE